MRLSFTKTLHSKKASCGLPRDAFCSSLYQYLKLIHILTHVPCHPVIAQRGDIERRLGSEAMFSAIVCKQLQIFFIIKHIHALKIKREVVALWLFVAVRRVELGIQRIKIVLDMLRIEILQNLRSINITDYN